MRPASVVVLLVVPAAPRGVAAAPDPQACVQAANEAGSLRGKGKLLAARDAAATCSDPACPSVVRAECVKLTEQIVEELPTVLVAATDGDGHDLVDVKVTVDAVVVRTSLDGTPIPLDPGPHTFQLARGGVEHTQTLVLKIGDKRRVVSAVLSAPKGGGGAGPAPPPAPLPAPAPVAVGPRLWPFVVGGAGLLLGASGLFLQLRTSAEARDLRGSCAPTCDEGDVSRLRTQYWIAGGLYGLSAAALGVAVFGLATRSPAIVVAPTSGGLVGTYTLRF